MGTSAGRILYVLVCFIMGEHVLIVLSESLLHYEETEGDDV